MKFGRHPRIVSAARVVKKKDSTYHAVLCDVVCRKRGEGLDDYSILCKNSGVFVEKR